ncbi:hypothetical protein Pelo_16341 [Pelomyxa schiedti]|nr:hypothetical protein Pelo_16341 [Pelomyxa schiedti]
MLFVYHTDMYPLGRRRGGVGREREYYTLLMYLTMMKMGTSLTMYHKGGFAATIWKDHKLVYVLSNVHNEIQQMVAQSVLPWSLCMFLYTHSVQKALWNVVGQGGYSTYIQNAIPKHHQLCSMQYQGCQPTPILSA